MQSRRNHNVMNYLPPTSAKNYITGRAALNIPYEDYTFADWHFTEVFLSGRGKFRVAGREAPDTSNFFGDYGIRECSAVLRRCGVAIHDGQEVYAANHVRAILDMVIFSIQGGRIPLHVTVEDILDDERTLHDLNEQLALLKKRITDNAMLSLLEQWIQRMIVMPEA